jgi:hypothetical protein
MPSPTTTKALVLEKSAEDKSPIYHDARIVERTIPSLKGSEILVQMGAVAFNHRDVGTLILYQDCCASLVLAMASQESVSWRFTRLSARSRWCRQVVVLFENINRFAIRSRLLGTVIDSALKDDELIDKRVFLTPSRGWKSNPTGPERKYEVLPSVLVMKEHA